MQRLISRYNKEKHKIKSRLKEFENRQKSNGKDIFAELCFCILTPQSKAVCCDKAICELKKSKLLFKGSKSDIAKKLKGLARFHNKKSEYIVSAREMFKNCRIFATGVKSGDVLKKREWLVRNIKGLGYKEASHFLRNIGLGKGIAILDVHILRNLRRFKVIKEIPKSLSGKNYLMIENKMRDFSKKVNIPIEELDLLFWSGETGFIFK